MTTRIEWKGKTIPILDKGSVRLVDWMGDDVRVVNAARISFEKWIEEIQPRDANLINFLLTEGHWSPFRHEFVSFVIRAPLMVARQHWKYVVGSDHSMDAWNEASRRYVTENEEFYLPKPHQWRSAPDNKKQGSGEPVPLDIGSLAFQNLMEYQEKGLALYHWALDNNICAEQARSYLPAYNLYVTYMWSASLQSLIHFLVQRVAHDAQKEIQDYARAIRQLSQPLFPVTFNLLSI
jgi:thymidylate synthase (FAD)